MIETTYPVQYLSRVLSIVSITIVTALSGQAQETLWQIGEADDSSGEFADYQASELEEISIPADAASVSKGLRRSVNPAMEITFELDEVPEHGAMLRFKLLDARKVTPEMAVFANGLMAGIVQLWGTAGTKSPHRWKKTYQLYIPAEMLVSGENKLRIEASLPLYSSSSSDSYLWWVWDYLRLSALTAPATEPVHGSVVYMGSTMKKKKNNFEIDQELVDLTPVVLDWLGIAHSGNTMRADFWSNIYAQPKRPEQLAAFNDRHMTVVANHLNTEIAQANMNGDELSEKDQNRLDNFFEAYSSLFQYYQVDNEPGGFGRSQAVNIAVAKYVNSIKPNHVATASPGWAYANWARDPEKRLEVEQFCQTLGGHSYGTSYADEQGGSFVENLETYGGVEDGWPKEMITTEFGTNDGHLDFGFLASEQTHASVFDRIVRAHIAVVDRFMQHATIFGDFGMFNQLGGGDPTSLTARSGVNNEAPRVKTFRRLALAYATHGAPVGYQVLNKEQVAGKKVYFRGVDTSTLPPLPGNGHTADKVLLNFVNFEATEQTLTVRINAPAGSYAGQRFGPGDSYQASQSDVTLEVNDELVISETLGPGEAVQYILPANGGWDQLPSSPSVDLLVEDISWTPTDPQAGDSVRFSARVTNQGSVPTPEGTVIGLAFFVDGSKVAWSDTVSRSLAVGESRVLSANGGPDGDAVWVFDPEADSVRAYVNDISRISEDNRSNNQLTIALTDSGASEGTFPEEFQWYYVENRECGQYLSVENCSQVGLSEERTEAQQWQWVNTGEGYYALQSRACPDLMIETNECSVVGLRAGGLNDDVRWELINSESDWYHLQNKQCGRRLDADTCQTLDANNGKDLDKQWRFVEVEGQDFFASSENLRNLVVAPEAELTMYPNPTSDYVTLKLSSAAAETVQLTVMHSSGQVVRQQSVSLRRGSNFVRVDVSSLSPGVYLLRTQTTQGQYVTRKLVIE